MKNLNRRDVLKSAGVSAVLAGLSPFSGSSGRTFAEAAAPTDSLPLQLYKSLSDEQREKVCLPVDHDSRQFVSNWWYIHRDHRIPKTFDVDQQQFCLLYTSPSPRD